MATKRALGWGAVGRSELLSRRRRESLPTGKAFYAEGGGGKEKVSEDPQGGGGPKGAE